MKRALIFLTIALSLLFLAVGCNKEPEVQKSFTVTFDYNGGVYNNEKQDTEKAENGAVSEPVFSPYLNKYTKFDSWTLKDGTEFDFENTKITCDITLYAKYKDIYSVGGTGEKGGIIIYDVDANNTSDGGSGKDGLKSAVCGYRYIEAAPSDFSTVVDGKDTFELTWGTALAELATGTAIGSGSSNTKLMAESTALNSFAKDVYGKTLVGDANDWFIPSRDELFLMYDVIGKSESAKFSKGYYWSSSRNTLGSSSAYCLYFGGTTSPSKDSSQNYLSSTARVRLIRVF